MPLQNRVDPGGAIVVMAARGTFMGNRGGVLHNHDREIVRTHAGRRWLICLLEFKDRHRTVMSPGLYTELFFLDEAVALAAGHRPCAECRRSRFNAFRDTWIGSAQAPTRAIPLAEDIDRELHCARINRRSKVTFQAPLHTLPKGCFVRIEGSFYLVWDKALFLWSPEGYLGKRYLPSDQVVEVVTPEPTVRCLGGGYKPEVHASALNL